MPYYYHTVYWPSDYYNERVAGGGISGVRHPIAKLPLHNIFSVGSIVSDSFEIMTFDLSLFLFY